jgi:Uma2 family endonuclease
MSIGAMARGKAAADTNGRGVSFCLDRATFTVPHEAHDLDGFRNWFHSDGFPDEGRVSFIDGEVIVDMSQEEYSTHIFVKAAIVTTLTNINDDEDLGTVAGDGGRITNEPANISNEPDAMFVSYRTLESKAAVFTPRSSDPEQTIELVGTPDLVVEVVSNSSEDKDYEKLRVKYHAAGIPEYWLVDARGEEVSFQILQHRRSAYVAMPNRDGWTRSRVLNREFRLVRKKNRMGMWKYRLETRSK